MLMLTWNPALFPKKGGKLQGLIFGTDSPGFIVRQQSRQREKYFDFESPKINVITYSNCLRVVRMLATLHLL